MHYKCSIKCKCKTVDTMSNIPDNKYINGSDDKEHEYNSKLNYLKDETNGKESEQAGENIAFIERAQFLTKGLKTEDGNRSTLYEFKHDVNFRHRLLHSGCVTFGMLSVVRLFTSIVNYVLVK